MPSHQTGPARRRRPFGRWLRRGGYFTGWLLSLLLAVLLLLGGALWLAYKNPTAMAKLGIEMFLPDRGLDVEEVDIDEPGVVRLRGLAAGPGVRIDEVVVEYSGRGVEIIKEGKVESLRVSGGEVRVDEALLAEWLPADDKAELDTEPDSGAAGGIEIPGVLGRFVPKTLAVDSIRFAIDLEGLPALEGEADFASDAVAELLRGESGREHQELELREVVWKREGGDAPVSFERLHSRVGTGAGFGAFELDELEIAGLVGKLTPEALQELLGEREAEGGSNELPLLSIGEVDIRGAELAIEGFEGLPAVGAVADIELGELRLEDGQLRSPARQSVVLREISAVAPGAEGGSAVRCERLDLALVPDSFFDAGWVEQLHLRGLSVDVSSATLGEFTTLLTGEGPDAPASNGGEEEPRGKMVPAGPYRVRDFKLGGGELSFDPEGMMAGLPAVRARLEGRSESEGADGDIDYALQISEIEIRETEDSERAFAKGGTVVAEFSALGLQRDGVIASVTARGLRAEVGEEVQRLVAAFGSSAPEKLDADPGCDDEPDAEAPAEEDGGWRLSVGQLDIDDTVVTLRDIIPGALPYLPLSIDTKLEDVPVIGRTKGDERVQRVEVKGVQIASPYNSLQNAAELKNVWVYFTIPGLLRNEIQKVEIGSPDIYVGEPLFWYVDYARKFAAGDLAEEGEVATGQVGEAGDEGEGGDGEPAGEDAPDAIVEGLKAFELSGWRIGEIAAYSGRIIIAPTGVPLGIVPFPFSAKTDFTGGEIELDVKVPTGDYVFEKLELEFRQLSGEALINYPNPAENNNFVQTFTSVLTKFKQFEAAGLWLSVTYDAKGIYGDFGGEAYGGYVNGHFNIYIDGPYRWDAWMTATGFDLGAFTDVLAPDQFKMSGKVDGKLIANGQLLEVERVTGSLKVKDGGTMHVIKLDDLKEALPEEWDPLWKALANTGIDALRNYQFLDGEAKLAYSDGEGAAKIRFQGDQGKRLFELRYHDQRPKE